MSDVVLMIGVFLGSFIVGYLLIAKVPSLLHTPLMSMTNAISAITILAAVMIFSLPTGPLHKVLGGIAVFTATFNVIGGFAVTDRMLKLFKARRQRS